MQALLFNGPWQAILGMAAVRSAGEIDPGIGCAVCLQRRNEKEFFTICKPFFEKRGVRLFLLSYEDFMSGDLDPELRSSLESCDAYYFPLIKNGLKLDVWPMIDPSRLSFYEDGLHSYTVIQNLYANQMGFTRPPLRKTIKSCIKTYVLKLKGQPVSRRISKFDDFRTYWSILDFPNAPATAKSIKLPYLLEEIDHFRKSLPGSLSGTLAPVEGTVILGTNFSMYGMLSADHEYDPVVRFIESHDPQDPLYWKPHPRASKLYTDYLVGRFPYLKPWPSPDAAVPFECFIEKESKLKLVSTMSTSLLYGSKLLGLQTRMIGDIEEPLSEKGRDLIESYRYLKSALNQIDTIPTP